MDVMVVAAEVSELVEREGPIARAEVRGRLGRSTQVSFEAIRLLVEGRFVRIERGGRRKAILHHVSSFVAGGER